MLHEGNISQPIFSISGMHVNSGMMIFAILKHPRNMSLVNHVWQEWLVYDSERLEMHVLSDPNVQSFENNKHTLTLLRTINISKLFDIGDHCQTINNYRKTGSSIQLHHIFLSQLGRNLQNKTPSYKHET